MRFSVIATAASALLALTLTACGGSPEPPPLDEPISTASASPLPTPTASPSAPADESTPAATPTAGKKQTAGSGALDEATKREAIGFVSGLLKALDEGGQTGNFTESLAMFDESCTTCKAGIAYAQSIYAQKHKLVGGRYTDPRYTVGGGTADDVTIQVKSKVSAYKIVDAAGKTVQDEPASDVILNLRIKKSSNGWHVVEWSNS